MPSLRGPALHPSCVVAAYVLAASSLTAAQDTLAVTIERPSASWGRWA
jgi:hypothetical protein